MNNFLNGRRMLAHLLVTVLTCLPLAGKAQFSMSVSESLDLGATRDILLFDRVVNTGSYRPSIFHQVRTGYWLCTNDPNTGACSHDVDESSPWESFTPIILPFKDDQGATRNLTLRGYKRSVDGAAMIGFAQALNQLFGDKGPIDRMRVHISLPKGEISKLPTGGTWTARLHLQFYDGQKVAHSSNDIIINIQLKLTDKNRAQIFFTTQGASRASVSIPLLHSGQAGIYSGTQSTEMCLYDGFDAQSSYYDITVVQRDPAANGMFSLKKSAPAAGDSSELPMSVNVQFNGKNWTVNPNVPLRLEKATASSIRRVKLPNIDSEVRCAIGNLVMTLPGFNALKKAAGKYASTLTLKFSASAQSL